MTPSAFQPYGLLFTELVQQALTSDRALKTAVAARRLRNRVVNNLYARIQHRRAANGGARERYLLQALERRTAAVTERF